MANPDNLAPTVRNSVLKVTEITENSISIQWEKAKDDQTAAKDIRYIVALTETDNDEDRWHIVCQEKDICSFTFTKLKADTFYSFYVMAYDEAGNITQYPLANGSMCAKTCPGDKGQGPTVRNKMLELADITNSSISIKWEKATDDKTAAKDIRYVVGLTEADNCDDPWHIVAEKYDIGAHTFKNLKSGTRYAFYVQAFDKDGNFCQYPLSNGSMTACTKFGDNQPPMPPCRNLDVVSLTKTTISIEWQKATDDKTAAKDIRYVVGLTEADNDQDPWHIVGESKDICKFTFKNLQPGTRYSFFVIAFDDAGNMCQYPGTDKSVTAKTL